MKQHGLNTNTKPGAIQTMQKNHNHKYLHVKGSKDIYFYAEWPTTQSLELF